MFAFQQPWVPEMVLRADDYAFIDAAMRSGSKMGLRRRDLDLDEAERYKDAAAQPGALTAALNYYRCGSR